MTFWWVPHLTGKRLFSDRLALWASWTWFVGMMVFALGMHGQGLLAVPRRALVSAAPDGAYADALVPRIITGISGVILFFAVIFYFTVLFGTIFARSSMTEAERPAIPFVEAVELRSKGVLALLDDLGGWYAVAVILVLVVYLPTLIDMFLNQVPMPPTRLW